MSQAQYWDLGAAIAMTIEKLEAAPELIERLRSLDGSQPETPKERIELGFGIVDIRTELAYLRLTIARVDLELDLFVTEIIGQARHLRHREEPPIS